MIETINKLKNLQCDLHCPEKISDLLSELNFKILSFIFEINTTPKNIIIRSRNNCIRSEIESIKDISYLDASKCIKYQRGSIPMKSCFYGSYTEPNIYEATMIELSGVDYLKFLAKKTAITSLLESGDFMEITNKVTTKYAICGVFKVVKPIRLVAIPSPESFTNSSGLFKHFANNYNNMYNQYNYSLDIDNMKELSSFIYEQFNKKCTSEEDYMIPALIAHSIMSIDGIDGLIYESVQSKSKSVLCETLNIALNSKSADEKLALDYCLEYKLRYTNNVFIPEDPTEFHLSHCNTSTEEL